MREIKFRAWDTKKKEMLYSENKNPHHVSKFACNVVPVTGGLSTMIINVGYNPENTITEWLGHAIPMQYTGLKDKNGVEIYEGDVVRMKGLIAGHFEPMVGYVHYEPPSFEAIAIEPKNVEGKGKVLDKRNVYEIIGNIHEDPKLAE